MYPAWKHLHPDTLQGFDYRRDLHCLEHVGLYAQQALSDAGLPSFTPPSHSAAAAVAARSSTPPQPSPPPPQSAAAAAAVAARPPPPPPPPPQSATAGPATAAAAQPPYSQSHSQPQPQPQQQLASAAAAAAPGVGTLHPTPHQAEPSRSYTRASCPLLLLPMLLLLPQALAGSTLGAWLTLGTRQPPRPP